MSDVMKELYDMRGSQKNLFRLLAFDKEAFIHMLFFRILIPVSIIYGIVLLIYIATSQLQVLVKPLTVLVWVLFTPQFFESAKTVSLINTRGLSMGHLSHEFVNLMKTKYRKNTSAYSAIPYGALALWAIAFVFMVVWWSV